MCGDLTSGPALGEHLLRMGEALGMAVVPLTPGGSVAIVPGVEEAPGQGRATAAAAAGEVEGRAQEQGGQQQEGAQSRASASTEGSEAARYRTTSE